MKAFKKCAAALLLAAILQAPFMSAAADVDRWVAGAWQAQDFISWGEDNLVVDFGPNGLWNFDGNWVQMSSWDPQRMAAWGRHNLVVDFGPNGLWSYDGTTWKKISVGSDPL